jgi:hypothetical protein
MNGNGSLTNQITGKIANILLELVKIVFGDFFFFWWN